MLYETIFSMPALLQTCPPYPGSGFHYEWLGSSDRVNGIHGTATLTKERSFVTEYPKLFYC